MSEREKIIQILAANSGTISDNLAEFLIRNIEDLQTAGVDSELLSTALLNVTTSFLIKNFGAVRAADHLRMTAAVCEHARRRFEGGNSAQAAH